MCKTSYIAGNWGSVLSLLQLAPLTWAFKGVSKTHMGASSLAIDGVVKKKQPPGKKRFAANQAFSFNNLLGPFIFINIKL